MAKARVAASLRTSGQARGTGNVRIGRAQIAPRSSTTGALRAVRPAGKTPTRAKKNAPFMYSREDVKGTYNTHDIMHSPVEKTLRILQKIIDGDRLFTM
jgi:hypothetical protein